MKALLQIDNVEITVARDGQSHTVQIPELHVNPHQTTILLGPSGAGKSVLLKTLSGVFPANLVNVSGKIELCGRQFHNSVSPEEPKTLADRGSVFYIFQDPRTYLHSRLKVSQYPALIAHATDSDKDITQKFISLIGEAGLGGRLDTPSGKLSGGEAQRLMLVMMQLLQPSVVLGDEPLSAQDRIHHENLRTSLNGYISDPTQQRGLLLVTHEIRDLERSFRDGLDPNFYVLEEKRPSCFCVSPLIDSEEIARALKSVGPDSADESAISTAEIPGTVREFFSSAKELARRHRPSEEADTDRLRKELIKTSGLSFGWGNHRGPALFSNLQIEAVQGKNLGLMGLSGVGKSTLAEILLRLVRGYEGKIRWFESNDLAESLFRNKVQYVFQDCERAMSWETGTLIEAVLRAVGRGEADLTKTQVATLSNILSQLGLSSVRDKNVLELSGGQLRRAYIARSLFKLLVDKQKGTPIVLVLDEATVGLDLVAQHNLLKLLDGYSSDPEQELTLITISHDPVVLKYLSDQLIVLSKSELDSKGAVIADTLIGDEIFRGPFTHEHTRELMDA